jgi:hypothetical protein
MHNGQLQGTHCSPNIKIIKTRKRRWVEYVAHMGRREMHTEFWCGNLNERDRLYDIKMNAETGWKGMDWIHLAQDRDKWRVLVNIVMNLRVPLMLSNE